MGVWLIYFFVFLFGLVVGSFLNCVIYRLALPNFSLKNLGGLKNRSYCPHCKKTLSWQDLIPVLSFLILRGRCRHCRQKISWQYPLVEIATGLLFLLIFNFQFSIFNEFSIFNFLKLIYYWTIACFLIVVFVYDLKHYIIPDQIVYPAILVSGIWYFISGIFDIYTKYEILNTIYSAFGAALFFLLIVLISRGKWMGVGDIKLAFFMGLILGFPNILVAIFSAFFIGAIIGIGLMLAGRKTMKSEIPFGPFLVTGTMSAIFFGESLTDWYLNLFLL